MTDEVLAVLEATFRADKLCPKCGGPIELNRNVTCWRCDLKAHMRTRLAVIDDSIMRMGNDLGIRAGTKSVVKKQTNKKPEKPKAKPKKKTKKK